MEDLYGVCFTSNADRNNSAKFYISLSPDYIYLHRFAFKIVVKPYASTVMGASGGDLSNSAFIITDTSTLDESLSGGVTNLDWAIKKFAPATGDWKIKIDGIDITPYLQEQHPNEEWLGERGEGIYPNGSLVGDDREVFYDILDVVSVMFAEGGTAAENAEKILKPKFKPVEISANGKFGVDLYLYQKYSTVSR